MLDPLNAGTSNWTVYGIDVLGRTYAHQSPDPDGVGGEPSPLIFFYFDARGRVTGTQEVIGAMDYPGGPETDDLATYFGYDHLDRRTGIQDPNPGTTWFEFDKVGNRTKLTDPVSNDTTWVFDGLNRVTTETNELGYSRLYAYDQVNNLTRLEDRKDQVRTFQYDTLYRRTAENWLDAQAVEVLGYDFTYNDAGELLTADDGGYAIFAWHTFDYDNLGRVERSNVWHFQGGALDAQLDQKHDAAGNRVELKSSVRFNGAADYTPDFVNSYAYDYLSRMTQVKQEDQAGGNVVADKLVNFRYNALGQFTDVDRFKDLAATQQVATADYLYDSLGRLKSLTYSNIPTPYQWTYDTASRVLSFNSQDGLQEYTYDKTSQLTDVKLNGAPTEDHDYDLNGNRTNTGYVTTANNQVQSDGTYTYTYDAEGNRATRAKIGTSEIEYYFWDYRNRLERVLQYNGATPVKFTAHHYDAFDRRIATWVDSTTSDGWENAAIERMVYDGDDVVLDFLDADGYGGAGATEQTKRYLHAAVDQVMAQEDPREDFGTVNRVLWHQADNLATVRDLARQDGTIATHFTYDSFGNVLAGDTSLTRYLFTGQEFDLATGLYLYNVRWYDPRIGRFVSEDPIGFAAGDANLSRYVGNSPTNATDPTGLYAFRITIHVETVGAPPGLSISQLEADLNYIVDNSKRGYLKHIDFIAKWTTGKPSHLGPVYSTHRNQAGYVYKRHVGHEHYLQFIPANNPKKAALAFTPHDLFECGTVTTVRDNAIESQAVDIAKKDPSRTPDLRFALANIIIHEVLWLGALGKFDRLMGGELSKQTANPYRFIIISGSDETAAAVGTQDVDPTDPKNYLDWVGNRSGPPLEFK